MLANDSGYTLGDEVSSAPSIVMLIYDISIKQQNCLITKSGVYPLVVAEKLLTLDDFDQFDIAVSIFTFFSLLTND